MKKTVKINFKPIYSKRHFIKNLMHIFDEIKFAFHRGIYGYTAQDYWNFDQWFVQIAQEMLSDLRENTHSHPGDLTEQEWDSILGQIIFYLGECDLDNLDKKEFDNYQERYFYMEDCKNKAFDLLKQYFFELWD